MKKLIGAIRIMILLTVLPNVPIAQEAPATPAADKKDSKDAKEEVETNKNDKRTLVDTLDEKVPLEVGVQLRIFKQARARKLEIDRMEGAMERRRMRLNQMLKEVEERYQSMRVLQDELTAQLKSANQEDPGQKKASEAQAFKERTEQVIKLSKVFNKMKADEASKMIPVMDESLVVEVMARLKPKQAASILGKLDAELAAKLTTRMAESKDVK